MVGVEEKDALSSKISEELGMNDEHEIMGIVVDISSDQFYGYNRKAVWEWISKELK